MYKDRAQDIEDNKIKEQYEKFDQVKQLRLVNFNCENVNPSDTRNSRESIEVLTNFKKLL